MKNTVVIKFAIVFLVIFFVFNLSAQSQPECKVLKPELSGTYTGGCKKGLAQGIGEAKGKDNYKGSFKKGFPDGKGKYYYSDGSFYEGNFLKGLRNGEGSYIFSYQGKDSIQAGIWKNDKYAGKKSVPPYSVQLKRNIMNYSISKSIKGDKSIMVVITKNASRVQPSDLDLFGSSGSIINSGSAYGFENVTYPFNGNIRYTMSNQLGTSSFLCEFQFTITVEGSWEVSISH
jgi:hypothetical protein